MNTTSGDMQCVNISIIDNFAYEKNESFSVHISSEDGVSVPDPYVDVVIADDEGEYQHSRTLISEPQSSGLRNGLSGFIIILLDEKLLYI